MRRVCFFNGDMSRNGGTERCTSLIANELSKHKEYKVFIIDISNKRQSVFFDILPEVEIFHLESKNLLMNVLTVIKFIKRYKIDVMINVEAMLGIYSVPAKVFTGVKNVIWEHGNFYQKQCRSIDKVRALEMRLCDYYITLTELDKHNFEQNFKGKCKVEYIYNPIEPLQYVPQYKGDTKTILSVGLVREIKGFDMLVDVADIVLKKHPDWKWLIYGSTDTEPHEYVDKIRNKISKYGLDNRLMLKGSTNEIYECYKNADIMIMTSRMEGLPMTLLEAKSYKLPIVSFDIMTGPSEIIGDNVNGFLIKPYDINIMAEKICMLIEDKELRQQFSDNAYVGIEKFNNNNIIKKWIKIIEG